MLRCWSLADGSGGGLAKYLMLRAKPSITACACQRYTSPLQQFGATEQTFYAGAQYGLHAAAVTSICLLPMYSRLAASRDASGALHLWSIGSGAQAACFPAPGLPPTSGRQQLRRPPARGWLPSGRLHGAGESQPAGAPMQRSGSQGLVSAGGPAGGATAAQEQSSSGRCVPAQQVL